MHYYILLHSQVEVISSDMFSVNMFLHAKINTLISWIHEDTYNRKKSQKPEHKIQYCILYMVTQQ